MKISVRGGMSLHLCTWHRYIDMACCDHCRLIFSPLTILLVSYFVSIVVFFGWTRTKNTYSLLHLNTLISVDFLLAITFIKHFDIILEPPKKRESKQARTNSNFEKPHSFEQYCPMYCRPL